MVGVNAHSRSGSALISVRERLDVLGCDIRAVLEPQQVLEQDLERVGSVSTGPLTASKRYSLHSFRADLEGLCARRKSRSSVASNDWRTGREVLLRSRYRPVDCLINPAN